MTQRYLVAKYAPDIMRMEPRNIGVILWANGQAASRFLPSNNADFVEDTQIYQRWIAFWERVIAAKMVTNGRSIPVDNPEFLDGLIHTQQGNFLLFDGGRVHDEVRNIQDATDFLFSELVAPLPSAEVQGQDQFVVACNRIFEESGLRGREDWRGEGDVLCRVKGIEHQFRYHYVFGNGQPTALLHRGHTNRAQSIHSVSFMMEYAAVGKRRRAVLVDPSQSGGSVEEALAIFQKFATVIDVNSSDAESKVMRVVGRSMRT